MTKRIVNDRARGRRISLRSSLLICAVGATIGWTLAVGGFYYLIRFKDGGETVVQTPEVPQYVSDEDARSLSEIQPAAGGGRHADTIDRDEDDPKTDDIEVNGESETHRPPKP
ncbi:MAG: hypothetical protein AAGF15_08440 [Pseudomonadota bacterium]